MIFVATSVRELCESRDSKYTTALTEMSLVNGLNYYVPYKIINFIDCVCIYSVFTDVVS